MRIKQNKKYRLILFIVLFINFNSCKNINEENFKNKILELESQNKNLKDSLKKITYEKLMNSTMVGYPNKDIYLENDSGKVFFYFKYPEIIPKYDIYTTAADLQPGKLILSNQTSNEFEIPFNTKELKNNNVEVIAVFKDIDIEILMSTQIKIQE